MSEQAMSKALDAIHEEAEKLLSGEVPEGVRKGLELIVSIARYKHDVRGKNTAAVEHRETYERDGVEYTITVERDEGALWGKWHCPLCDEGGSSSKRCTSVESAVEAAIANIGPHPAMKHKKS
jgi:hypothetical protein